MTTAYVSSFDSRDMKAAWSGTGYFMAEAINRQPGLELERVGPLNEKYRRLFQAKQAFHRYLGGGRTHIRELEPTTMREWGRQAALALRGIQPDIFLTPLPQIIGALDLATVLPEVPRVVWTDATFDNLVGYYERYSKLSQSTLENGHRLWNNLSERGTHFIFSSDWAARNAQDRYRIPSERVNVVSFGTNFDEIPQPAYISESIAKRPTDRCDLVFLSVDWHRKGGPFALRVAQLLNDSGIPTSLSVVGCKPEFDGTLPDFVRPLGYIPKNTAEGSARLSELLLSSHFLILPSLADCTPMVVAEANSHGLPALARDTGGISSLVSNGANGVLFKPTASAYEYAQYVVELMAQPGTYEQLAHSSRNAQERRLNWDTAGKAVAKILRGVAFRNESA